MNRSLKVLVDEFRLENDKLSKLSTKAVREVSKAAAHLNESVRTFASLCLLYWLVQQKDAIEKATDNLSSLTAATRSTKRGIAEMKSKIAKLQLSVDNKPAVYDPKPFKEQKVQENEAQYVRSLLMSFTNLVKHQSKGNGCRCTTKSTRCRFNF